MFPFRTVESFARKFMAIRRRQGYYIPLVWEFKFKYSQSSRLWPTPGSPPLWPCTGYLELGSDHTVVSGCAEPSYSAQGQNISNLIPRHQAVQLHQSRERYNFVVMQVCSKLLPSSLQSRGSHEESLPAKHRVCWGYLRGGATYWLPRTKLGLKLQSCT